MPDTPYVPCVVTFVITEEEYDELSRVATAEEREPARQAKVYVLQALKKWPQKPPRVQDSPASRRASDPSHASRAKSKAEGLAAVTNGSPSDGA